MIETRQLRKEFGDLVAVCDLNLLVPTGDVFALIGPNGAGKTTLLKMLAGLLEPTDGHISINGVPVVPDKKDYYRFIGLMPDIYSLYEDLKVWEYLDFFAACHEVPLSQRKGRIDSVIELVNLEVKRESLIQGLSKGMKQRLLLAKTLLHDPEVLLLDEPAAGLDPKARIGLREIIKKLQREGKTLLVSSHILSELADFCNAYGIMEKGSFVKTGRFDESAPESTVRTFVVELLQEHEGLQAILSEFSLPVLERNGLQSQVTLKGGLAEAVRLNQALTAAGVPVIAFFEKKENIEDLFMRYSQHEVS